MVERFQQGKLASALTPVNEPDQSLAKGAALIAQAADRHRDMLMGTAAGHLARAEGSFARANAFAQQAAGSVIGMLGAGLRANKGAGDEERRRIEVALARVNENDLAEQTFKEYRERFADNPGAAIAAFEADVPTMRQGFQERYGADPKSFTALLPIHDTLERQTKARLESWAQKTQNAQLESRLNLLPEELSAKIDGFQGSVDEQFESFQSLLASSNDVYKQMFASAQDEGTMNNIKLQKLKLDRKLSQDFMSHLVAQTPRGEAGIGYIDSLTNMVQNAHQLGFPLSSDDQKSMAGALDTARREQEEEAILSAKIDGDIKLLSINKFKADIYDRAAAGDQKGLAALSQEMKSRLDGLDQQIERVSAQPDSNLKKAKILALKQEQNAYITGIGMELNQQRTLVNIQNSIISMARAARGEQRALAGLARSNIMFTNYLADRELRQQEKELTRQSEAAHIKQIDSFNNQWSGITNDLRSVYALPAGEAQTKRILQIAKQAQPLLDSAVKAGTITRDQYRSYTDQLSEELDTASRLETTKPSSIPFTGIQWGGGQVRERKKADQLKVQQASQRELANILGGKRQSFDDLGLAFSYLSRSGANKKEQTVLKQYLDTKLPAIVRSEKFQKLPKAQRERDLAGLVNKSLQEFRKGNLK